MPPRSRAIILAGLILIAGCGRSSGVTRIVQTNGTVVVGTIVDARPDAVVIRTSDGGTQTIARSAIVSMQAMQPAAPATPAPTVQAPVAQALPPAIPAPLPAAQAPPAAQNVTPPRSSTSIPSAKPQEPKPAPDDGRRAPGMIVPAPAPIARGPVVPAGTTLSLELQSTLDSTEGHPGDRVQASLASALTVSGAEVLAAGTEVSGRITQVSPSQRVSGRAYIVVQFDRVMTSRGVQPLRAAALHLDAASTAKRDLKRTGLGAAVGGAIGGLVGRSKKAVGIGVAAGAGVAGAQAAMTKGDEIRLEAGQALTVRLAAPLSLPPARP